jgi:hypothetical protein
MQKHLCLLFTLGGVLPCHRLQMNLASGTGALTAIQDAVALANWICTPESASLPNLETIFNEHHAERYPLVKSAFAISQVLNTLAELYEFVFC